jgi:magnesium chelatase subunit I
MSIRRRAGGSCCRCPKLALGAAIKTFFLAISLRSKLEKPDEKTAYTDLIEWFFAESGFELLDDCSDAEYSRILGAIVPLEILIKKYQWV